MAKVHDPKIHLWNHDKNKTFCGKSLDQFDAAVTDVGYCVTCGVCTAELNRIQRQVAALLSSLGAKVFVGLLEDSGVALKRVV